MKITADYLRELDACDYQRIKFEATFPSGVEITPESVQAARAAGLDVEWLLRAAADRGHVAVVRDILAAGADVHSCDDAALCWSAERGHEAVVRTLLAAGADVHADNDELLHWAADRGHEAVVRTLLAAGADVHADNDAALRWSAERGHAEVVRTLLAAGADPRAGGSGDLITAARAGHAEVVRTLLAALGLTTRAIAARAGVHRSTVDRYIRGESRSPRIADAIRELMDDLESQSPPSPPGLPGGPGGADDHPHGRREGGEESRMKITSVYLGELDACDYQLEKFESTFPAGVEITPESVQAARAAGLDVEWLLRAAAECGHAEVVRDLLAAGANVRAGAYEVLCWAAERGHAEVIRLLLAAVGLTAQAIAARAGVHRSTVDRYLRGESRSPRVADAIRELTDELAS